MSSVIFENARLVLQDEVLPSATITVIDGQIAEISPNSSGKPAVPVGRVVECDGRRVSAGMVDVQVNGGGGYMFSTHVDKSEYVEIGRAHARLGVTSICPTLITSPADQMLEAASTVADLCDNPESDMARFPGIHIEGPFLSAVRRGGHAERYLREPSLSFTKELLAASRGYVRIFSIAPELPGAMDVIDYLVSQGIFVSAGHTDADAATMHAAIRHGMRGVTHIFNGMDALYNRQPGVAGVALSTDSLVVGLIADLLHVSHDTARVVVRSKRADALYLTTDAVSPIGASADSFDLYGVTVHVRDGGCYTEEGVLAGTATPLPIMVKNAMDSLAVDEVRAFAMATSVPGAVLRDEGVGRLQSGGPADIVVFNDDMTPYLVMIGGDVLEAAD